MEKTQIMRPPFYNIDIESINLKSPMEEPWFFDVMPPWQIHPMNLPGWKQNPDIENLVEEYNDKSFDRNFYADAWFIYEAYTILKSKAPKKSRPLINLEILNMSSIRNEGDRIYSSFDKKPTHKYEKYFAEYAEYEKTLYE